VTTIAVIAIAVIAIAVTAAGGAVNMTSSVNNGNGVQQEAVLAVCCPNLVSEKGLIRIAFSDEAD